VAARFPTTLQERIFPHHQQKQAASLLFFVIQNYSEANLIFKERIFIAFRTIKERRESHLYN